MDKTWEAKLTEECRPLWVTTSGLPMDDKYQQTLNGFFSRFGTIVKDTRKKLWTDDIAKDCDTDKKAEKEIERLKQSSI